MRVPARAVAYPACVFTLIFLTFRPLQAQHPQTPASPAEAAPALQGSAASTSAARSNAPQSAITIFYTSQLFGYFRAPDLQSGVSAENGCKSAEDSESPAAQAFDVLWGQQPDPGKILVGTGNNLAPVLWARQFDPAPLDRNRRPPWNITPANVFPRTSKELFAWDPSGEQWLTNENISENPVYKPLLDKLDDGDGTIPTDNVACFLRRAGYAAIVPGKYDFYYGPERLRELARFLASNGEEPITGPDAKPVVGP